MLAWLVASSLAMAHTELGGFRVNIGGLYIVWLAPQNPYLDNGRIMFPLEGLIHVTRGMENFRIESQAKSRRMTRLTGCTKGRGISRTS